MEAENRVVIEVKNAGVNMPFYELSVMSEHKLPIIVGPEFAGSFFEVLQDAQQTFPDNDLLFTSSNSSQNQGENNGSIQFVIAEIGPGVFLQSGEDTNNQVLFLIHAPTLEKAWEKAVLTHPNVAVELLVPAGTSLFPKANRRIVKIQVQDESQLEPILIES